LRHQQGKVAAGKGEVRRVGRAADIIGFSCVGSAPCTAQKKKEKKEKEKHNNDKKKLENTKGTDE
jgi:hypothetical protein